MPLELRVFLMFDEVKFCLGESVTKRNEANINDGELGKSILF